MLELSFLLQKKKWLELSFNIGFMSPVKQAYLENH